MKYPFLHHSGEEPLVHLLCRVEPAVDLNSCVGSLLAVGLVVFVSFHTKED